MGFRLAGLTPGVVCQAGESQIKVAHPDLGLGYELYLALTTLAHHHVMKARDNMSAVIEALQREHGLLAAYLEATELAGFAETEAKRLFGRDPTLPDSIRQDYLTPWSAAKAEKRFLARFKALAA